MSTHSGYDQDMDSQCSEAPQQNLSGFASLAFKSVGGMTPGTIEFHVTLAECITEIIYKDLSKYIADLQLTINKASGKQPGNSQSNYNSATKNATGKKIPFSQETTIPYANLHKSFPKDFATELTASSPAMEKEIVKYISNFPFTKADPATMFALTASAFGETAKKVIAEFNKAAAKAAETDRDSPEAKTWEKLIEETIKRAEANPSLLDKLRIKGVSDKCVAGIYARQHCYTEIKKRNTISKNLNELFEKIRNKFDPNNVSGSAPPPSSLSTMVQQRPNPNNVFLPQAAGNLVNAGMNQAGQYRQVDPMQQRNMQQMMPPQVYPGQGNMFNMGGQSFM